MADSPLYAPLDDHKSHDIATALIERARRAGADAAEAVVSQSETLGVSARGGAMEDAERAETVDFSLTVMLGAPGTYRQAEVSASDASAETLRMLVERAMAMAEAATDDPYIGPAELNQLASEPPELDLLEESEPPSPDALLETALELEAKTLTVSGVRQSEGASAGWARQSLVRAMSNGFHRGFRSGSHSISVSAIAGEGVGMERDYAFSAARWREDLRPVAEIAQEAGERAVKRLAPRKPKTGAYPVVFEPRMAAGLIGSLLGLINGASVARGATYLAKQMGERILPAGVDLIDDPLLKRGLGSRPFDGDGLPGRRKALIKDGVLCEWLLDLASARQLGVESNGASGGGGPAASNAWITPGELSASELIKDIDHGLYVTEMMGRGANPITGDYSRGASGFWIEHGEIAYPVSELTIAGHMTEMLRSLRAADDLSFDRRVNAPTLRVEGMTLAAE